MYADANAFLQMLNFMLKCCKRSITVLKKVLWLAYTVLVPSFNPFPNKPLFLRVCSTSLLKKLWEKEKLLVTSIFSSSHGVFYMFEELFSIFVKFEIVVCKLFQFGSLKFVVWEGQG